MGYIRGTQLKVIMEEKSRDYQKEKSRTNSAENV